jgi:hypothetical protein
MWTGMQAGTTSEKFAPQDLQELRRHILAMGADYDGAAEVIQAFLSGRGYGISPESARHAVVAFGADGCSLGSIRDLLNQAALEA